MTRRRMVLMQTTVPRMANPPTVALEVPHFGHPGDLTSLPAWEKVLMLAITYDPLAEEKDRRAARRAALKGLKKLTKS